MWLCEPWAVATSWRTRPEPATRRKRKLFALLCFGVGYEQSSQPTQSRNPIAQFCWMGSALQWTHGPNSPREGIQQHALPARSLSLSG